MTDANEVTRSAGAALAAGGSAGRADAGPAPVDLWRHAIEASAHAMVICNARPPEFAIEYVNLAFERITGYCSDEIVGRSCRVLQGEDREQAGIAHIRRALSDGVAADAVVRNYRKDGRLFWNHLFVAPVLGEGGTPEYFVASQYDVTHTKELEARLLHLATHDELTGLPNRILLRDRLGQAMHYAARAGHQVWIAFISLDRFKAVNDSLGHHGGDVFLKAVATRLSKVVRASDTVARWGGDEFAVVIAGSGTMPPPDAALERLIQAVSEVIAYDGQEYVMTCRIGVAAYPADGETVDCLLQRADTATFEAKRDGYTRFHFHHAGATAVAHARLQTESQLRHALKRGEFVLHYQPQVDLLSGRVIGAEALVRWQHPSRGLLGPFDFIGIAEDSGLIVALGEWVLRAACEQNLKWQQQGFPCIRMAVNLSAVQFSRSDLTATVARVLGEVGMPAHYLELELTESVVMDDVDHGIATLRALKALGVTIAIDDFGTGYSSLAYLKRFPIDVLKIDRSFVTDIANGDGDDAAIVASIIALAHTLKLKVIAEGVETIEQLEFMRRHNCDEIQGFYVSKPVLASAFQHFLGSRTMTA